MGEPRPLESPRDLVQIRGLRSGQVARSFQPHVGVPGARSEARVRRGKRVQTFFRRDASEIADAEHTFKRRAPLVAIQVDAERNDVDPIGGNLQQPGHDRRIVAADRQKAVDVGDLLADQVDRLLPERLDQTVEKKVFSLQRAADRLTQCLPQRSSQPDQQRVGQVDHVGHRFVSDPLQQLFEFPAKDAAVSFQHRDRQLAEHPRIGRERSAGERVDHPWRVPQPVEETRRLPKDRKVLLEVDADPAKQHALAADVGFVGVGRRIQREQGDLMATRQQLHGQRVVTRATAAIHPRGAGGNRQDAHVEPGTRNLNVGTRSRFIPPPSAPPAPGTGNRSGSLRAAAAS